MLDSQPDPTAHLARFEGSFFGLCAQVEPVAELDKPEFLIIYLPGVVRDRKTSVLMELEKGGTCYEPQLKGLARNMLRQFLTDGAIDELLTSDRVTYQDIVGFVEQSEGGETRTSMLRTIFRGASSEVLLARWLADKNQDNAIAEKHATDELLKLIQARLGFQLDSDTSVAVARSKVLRYVLANDFRSDLSCKPPGSLSLIPAPKAKEQLARVRDVAARLRNAHADPYEGLADQVETELGLRRARIDPARLGSVDTFRFEEQALLAHAGALIAKKAYREALEIVSHRSRSFWIDRGVRRRAQWEACRLMAKLGAAVKEVCPGVSKLGSKAGADAASWVEAYASPGGWYRLDLLQRGLEAWIAKMDEEPATEQALGVVRRHHEDALKKMAHGFSRAFVESGWTVSDALHQTRIYPDVVEAMGGRVAYFLVDAMRYEMGVDLARQLKQSKDVTVRPAIAALPSITPLGMAALLPEASSSYSVVEHKGRLAACIRDMVMASLAERMRHLRTVRPDVKDLNLGDLPPEEHEISCAESRLRVSARGPVAVHRRPRRDGRWLARPPHHGHGRG